MKVVRAIAFGLALLIFALFAGPLACTPANLGIPAGVLLLRDQVDEMLKAANHAVDTFAKEAAATRNALFTLHDKLKATGQELLANDLREFSRRAVGDVGVEYRFNLEFTEAKAKRYLVACRDAIARAKNKLLLTADLKTAQEIVCGIIKDVDTEMSPAIPSFSPSVVKVVWKDHATPAVTSVPGELISFTGAALRPKDLSDLRLVVLGPDEKVRRDATEHLTIHTPYTATIDLSSTGLRFQPKDADDRRLRLVYKGETIGEIKIQWDQQPPVPPKIINLKSVMSTLSHKEAAGQVEQTFFHDGRKLADSLHVRRIQAFGVSREISVHIGAYDTWEKGHFEVFSPPGGLTFNPDYKAGDEIKVQIALGAVPGECNINWRGEISYSVILNDGREIPLGSSGGFWFRNNSVEDPQHLRGNRIIEVPFKLPPLPPK